MYMYIYIYMNIQVYAYTSSPRCGACAQCPLTSYICCVCTRSVGSVICGLRLHSAPFTWPRLHSVAHSHLLIALQVYVVAELWTVLSLQLHLSSTASCRHSLLWLDPWPEPGHWRSSWPFFLSSVYMYIYVTRVYVYIYIYAYRHIYVFRYTYVSVCIYIHRCIHI